MERSSLETIPHMVASGAGTSIVPVSAAKSWPQNEPMLQFRPFSEPAPFRKVVIAWRTSLLRSRAIYILRDAIRISPPSGVTLSK
jgi:LysR family transcriptional regulator, hydrogen peroxide-inducible genes activator